MEAQERGFIRRTEIMREEIAADRERGPAAVMAC
jgi:hypothetical protein